MSSKPWLSKLDWLRLECVITYVVFGTLIDSKYGYILTIIEFLMNNFIDLFYSFGETTTNNNIHSTCIVIELHIYRIANLPLLPVVCMQCIKTGVHEIEIFQHAHMQFS